MFFNPLYLVFALPGLLLGLWAQSRVKSNFNKYSKVRTARNLTGADVARQLLDAQGLYDVAIEETQGMLSDHYDPRSKVLRLSPTVYRTPSIAAAGVAAHDERVQHVGLDHVDQHDPGQGQDAGLDAVRGPDDHDGDRRQDRAEDRDQAEAAGQQWQHGDCDQPERDGDVNASRSIASAAAIHQIW